MDSRSLSPLQVEIYIGWNTNPHILVDPEEQSATVHHLLHLIVLLQFVLNSMGFKNYPSSLYSTLTLDCFSDPLLQTVFVRYELFHRLI